MTLSFPTRRSGDLADLTREQVEDMVRYLAIANYEDRFVIPTTHREYAENAFDLKGGCGFSFGNGCSGGSSAGTVFGHNHASATPAATARTGTGLFNKKPRVPPMNTLEAGPAVGANKH